MTKNTRLLSIFSMALVCMIIFTSQSPAAFAGLVCSESDPDCDNVFSNDNCPLIANQDQLDSDVDEVGDVCDNAPNDFNPGQEDTDFDDIGDVVDNCPNVYNPDQEDVNDDGIGDACVPTSQLMDDIFEVVETTFDDIVNLNEGEMNSLIKKIESAADKLDSEQINGAIGSLIAFINQTEAKMNSGQIPLEEGLLLIEAAQNIIDALEEADSISEAQASSLSEISYFENGVVVLYSGSTAGEILRQELFELDAGDVTNLGLSVSKAAKLQKYLAHSSMADRDDFKVLFHKYKNAVKSLLGIGGGADPAAHQDFTKQSIKIEKQLSKLDEGEERKNKIKTAIEISKQNDELQKLRNKIGILESDLSKSKSEKDKKLQKLYEKQKDEFKELLILNAKWDGKTLSESVLEEIENKAEKQNKSNSASGSDSENNGSKGNNGNSGKDSKSKAGNDKGKGNDNKNNKSNKGKGKSI